MLYNHYSKSIYIIVKNIIEEDKKMDLEEAMEMASWTHNTNVNVL